MHLLDGDALGVPAEAVALARVPQRHGRELAHVTPAVLSGGGGGGSGSGGSGGGGVVVVAAVVMVVVMG